MPCPYQEGAWRLILSKLLSVFNFVRYSKPKIANARMLSQMYAEVKPGKIFNKNLRKQGK